MPRRHRREFQGLEKLLVSDFQATQWKALIAHIHGEGPGPKSIVEQFRIREKLLRKNARRDRWNQVRYKRRYEALMRMIGPRHVIAVMAIRAGIVECCEGELPRDLLLGAMAGWLTRKFLEELETIHETIQPALPPWEIDHRRIEGEKQAQPAAREERHLFEESLIPTPLPIESPAEIPFGFPVSIILHNHSNAPETTPAARAAS